jgi:hypothetical protein
MKGYDADTEDMIEFTLEGLYMIDKMDADDQADQ